jgi:nitroimidazol reductase NimA-like FMN-containing flavoprotein (pyridoxamine 5'-phosphate oxidase superfamily)
MSEEIVQKIAEYLASHRILRLATVTPEGDPMAHTITYACEGTVVYFLSERHTRKVRNILEHPRISYTVDENYEDLRAIEGVEIEGIAETITDPVEADRVLGLLHARFPELEGLSSRFEMIPLRITPVVGYYLKTLESFVDRQKVTF